MVLFQSKPGRGEFWYCGECRRDTDDTRDFHFYFKHEVKYAALCCIFCEHQDVIGQAFSAHLDKYHNVVVEDIKCLSLFRVVGLPPFKQLGHCPKCKIRMVETIYSLPAHKEACTGPQPRPEKSFKLNAEEQADFEIVFEKELASLRREWTTTPPPPRAAKPAAQRFYLPAGAEDDSSEDEWQGAAAMAVKPAAAYTDAKNAVARFRANTEKMAASSVDDAKPDDGMRRDGSMTPAERALVETKNFPHNVLAVGEITARLPEVDFVRKRFYCETAITPGIYDIMTADGDEVRLIMENHPANVYWAHVTPPDIPRNHGMDRLDVNQWLTNARPYVIVGVGSLQRDIPSGQHRLIQRKSGSTWSWFTIDESALLAADNVG